MSTRTALVSSIPRSGSPTLSVSASPWDGDYIFRGEISGGMTLSLSSMMRSIDFETRLETWASSMIADVAALQHVALWQHKVIEYNSLYQAYLMDQLTDDEFETEAEKYAYEQSEISRDELRDGVGRIYRLTNIAYSPSDIADLFHCSHEEAVEAVTNLAVEYPAFLPMVPGEGSQ